MINKRSKRDERLKVGRARNSIATAMIKGRNRLKYSLEAERVMLKIIEFDNDEFKSLGEHGVKTY